MSTQDKQVVLQVGDRRFTASIDVLVERSEYFNAMFSGNWLVKKQEDGSIFFDGDGNAFEHVIAYIRRGVFPLVFDPDKGHDHFLYLKVLQEAKYFQCPHLITWLEHRCYYHCVHRTLRTDKREDLPHTVKLEDYTTNFKLKALSTTDREIYLCPRNILSHRGSPDKCGRRCSNAQVDEPRRYDTERGVADWLITQTSTVFDHGWMTDAGEDFLRYIEALRVDTES